MDGKPEKVRNGIINLICSNQVSSDKTSYIPMVYIPMVLSRTWDQQ